MSFFKDWFCISLFLFALLTIASTPYVQDNQETDPVEIYSFEVETIFRVSYYNETANQIMFYLDKNPEWTSRMTHISSSNPIVEFELFYDDYLLNDSIVSVDCCSCEVYANTSLGYEKSEIVEFEFYGSSELYVTAFFDFFNDTFIWEGLTWTPNKEEN